MIAAVLLAPVPATAAAPAAQPYCGITWGSLAKQSAPFSDGEITAVRTGRHSCYDRLVIDLNGSRSGYTVAYADQVLTEGKGDPISLRGGARLAISVRAPAYDDTGHATYLPAQPGELRNLAGYQTFRQVAWGGSHEGYTTIGLGVRARLPFRVFTLAGPGSGSRLVIDVAHFWQAPGGAPAASAAAPFCGITWGSLAKQSATFTTGDITDVRTGRHACYDRLVIDLNGSRAGYSVAYADQVLGDGSGLPIEVRGGARLGILVRAPAHDEDYNLTYRPADRHELRDVSGYRTFRQVASGGTYEGDTTFALGVRARLPFRVFTLDGPGSGSRLVIDVAHRW